MCVTCDLAGYVPEDDALVHPIGYGDLVMVYKPKTKKYFVSTCGDARSDFRVYYCLTCGRKLWTNEG